MTLQPRPNPGIATLLYFELKAVFNDMAGYLLRRGLNFFL